MNNLYIPGCDGNTFDTYYGGYRTRTFCDIFTKEGDEGATYDAFLGDFKQTPFYDKTAELLPNLEVLFYMLYARYGNSHIAFSDENQFKFALFTIVYQYGPTWTKRLDIQQQLRRIGDTDILVGSTDIYNHSYNPSTAPTTQTLTELPTINDQNTKKKLLSPMDAYANLMTLLETDVTEEFLTKFRKLFIKVLAPDRPLLYTTEIMEDN